MVSSDVYSLCEHITYISDTYIRHIYQRHITNTHIKQKGNGNSGLADNSSHFLKEMPNNMQRKFTNFNKQTCEHRTLCWYFTTEMTLPQALSDDVCVWPSLCSTQFPVVDVVTWCIWLCSICFATCGFNIA